MIELDVNKDDIRFFAEVLLIQAAISPVTGNEVGDQYEINRFAYGIHKILIQDRDVTHELVVSCIRKV